MGWLDRIRRPRVSADTRADEPDDLTLERSSPGLSMLFDTLEGQEGFSVLDLGLASDGHLRLFGRFAQQIRFAGLVPRPPRGPAWGPALRGLPPNDEHPYEVVLAWDVFDRIDQDERAALVERLAELCSPGARLYAVVDTSGTATTRPVRMTALEEGRIRETFVGAEEPARPTLLPAQVERVLAPFRVLHAFTLRSGKREYVARLGGHTIGAPSAQA